MGVQYLANLSFYLPELAIVLTLCGVIFMEAFYKPRESGRLFLFLSAGIGLLVSLVALIFQYSDAPTLIFSQALAIDPFSTFAKIIMVLGTGGVIYLSYFSQDIYTNYKSEFVIMVLGVLVGGMLLASANNLLTLYLGIEILSILSYILSALKRHEKKSLEAGLKYALYGGLSAGVMLFGMSHIFGALGTINFQEIAVRLGEAQSSGFPFVLSLSFLLFFVGLGFKIACVPFHMWSPDVYEGSPIPVATFFAIVPKLAGLIAIIRITTVFFAHEGTLQTSWIGLLHLVAALTMTVGNVSAIGQDSVKRLLAFSSIGHAGMMLLTALSFNQAGHSALLFYGFTYLFMTLVAFSITSFINDKTGSDSQDYFKGLIHKHPIVVVLMTITLFSLAGMPPFAGFIAKYNIFALLLQKKYYGLAFIAGLNSVIALYYYLRLVKLMIFDKPEFEGEVAGFGFQNQLVLTILTVPLIFFGLFWEKIYSSLEVAKIFLSH